MRPRRRAPAQPSRYASVVRKTAWQWHSLAVFGAAPLLLSLVLIQRQGQAELASQTAIATFESLLSAECRSYIPVLDLRRVPRTESRLFARGFPEDIRCPVHLLGVTAWTGAEELLRHWDWSRLRRAGPQALVPYDVSDRKDITYWDNQTALADHVRAQDPHAQGFVRATGPPARVIDAVRGSHRNARSTWTRMALPLADFSTSLSMELARAGDGTSPAGPLARIAPSAGVNVAVNLFVSSAGVTSTAHYDSFANTHVLLHGRKHIDLAPPRAIQAIGAYPATHPRVRQLRRTLSKDGLYGVQQVELSSGEALFIPPGWAHQVSAQEASAAISLTHRAAEFRDFNDWITPGQPATKQLPFLASLGTPTMDRLAAALIAYIPQLIHAVYADETDASAATHAEPRHPLIDILSSYSRDGFDFHSMNDAGTLAGKWMVEPASWSRDCPKAIKADETAIRRAVDLTATRLRRYHASTRPVLLQLYLENAIAKVGELSLRERGESGRSLTREAVAVSIVGVMLAFIQECLLPNT